MNKIATAKAHAGKQGEYLREILKVDITLRNGQWIVTILKETFGSWNSVRGLMGEKFHGNRARVTIIIC